MRRSIAPRKPFAKWHSFALAALLGLTACAPATRPSGPTDGPPREPTVRVGILVDSTYATLGATTTLEILDGVTRQVLVAVGPTENVRIEASGSELVLVTPQGRTNAGGMLMARATAEGFIRIAGKPKVSGSQLMTALRSQRPLPCGRAPAPRTQGGQCG